MKTSWNSEKREKSTNLLLGRSHDEHKADDMEDEEEEVEGEESQ